MKISCIGGGPAGLYFAILMKKADPSHCITIYERNQPDDTFGFGVVFSDATGSNLRDADPETFDAMMAQCATWDDIEIHYRDQVLASGGHGFSGLSRAALLQILTERCRALGVDVRFGVEVSDIDELRDVDLVLGADGFNSVVREKYADSFRPHIDWRPNRFVWLGTTRPFPAFTFFFRYDEHGLWRIHAYQYTAGHSTFIVETTETTWRAAGMHEASEAETLAFCERLFAEELAGHALETNRSIWRQFPTLRTECWRHENVVLIGDAAHTAHVTIGSGTKLAMEDAVSLANALQTYSNRDDALAAYEEERRPVVESTQRAAQVSLQWFEDTERYMTMDPTQFAFNLLTRSFRITHDNLRVRDATFIAGVNDWFAERAELQSGISVPRSPAPPPLFTPFKLRDLLLENRVVVSPMCQYSAVDGTPNDWHLVHIGARAQGGAALVITEMTDVNADARITPGCAGIYKPEHTVAWKRIVDFVHRHTSAKIGMQLGHAGRKGSTCIAWEGMDEPLPDGNWPIVAPSALPYLPHSQTPLAMTREQMEQVRDDFASAAERADEAGFDLLELHLAHGYLLATFISPLTNERADEYGGTLENRLRFPLEVFDAVRQVWPDEKPMSARISAVDWAPGGTQPEDAVAIASALAAHGCDIVDVSAGQTVADARPVYGRQFQTPFADRVRHEAEIATMAVGNISSYTDVNTILAAGRADLCVLARAHLWDPYWTRHAAHELEYDLPWPPQYEVLNNYKPRFT
jgi:anthraniloyl-CoA monooxygenase